MWKTTYISHREQEYPKRMQKLTGMPKGLYVRGSLPRDDLPTIGIVGARMCSSYGKNLAYEFAKVFSRNKIQVISGMALGIDGEAHRGALAGETPTYAVLGCGVDICYPKYHGKLRERILEQGGLISEFPDQTPPIGRHFPARNRIISALSDVLLVVEAKEKSGSLITVDFALEQGKSVYAIPGRVGDLLSLGCHQLIEQGAGIAYSPETVMKEFDMKLPKEKIDRAGENKIHPSYRGDLKKVFDQLETIPKSLTEIQQGCGLSISCVLECLLRLQLDKSAVEVSRNYYACK